MDFVDDYERPVLEKYEKVTPTPSVREKKEKEQKVNINFVSTTLEYKTAKCSIKYLIFVIKTGCDHYSATTFRSKGILSDP